MRLLDSRRIPGPSLLLDVPGAVLEVALDGVAPETAIAAWREALAALLTRLDWAQAPVAARSHAAGLTLAFGAPFDVLYAATEVNEAAWEMAADRLAGRAPAGIGDTVARLARGIAEERKPEWHRLAVLAADHDVTLLVDDRRLSVGLGVGSRAWPVDETPNVLDVIPWGEVHDIPAALVTGTNGKTTTVRLLGAMAAAAGRVAGVTSTDQVTVGDDVVAVGDYSGPNGARTVLRDRRVEMAILEVARGGILRRGLALHRARAVAVTNVANDHLGEFGIFDIEALADVKMVVAKAVLPGGRVVLNADDPLLLARGLRLAAPVTWFSLDPAHPALREHLARDGDACWPEDGWLVLGHGASRRRVITIGDVPITFGGTAGHNVANALTALGVADALGMPLAAMARGLAGFASDAATNPGRGNVWRLGEATVIVDFAHNPHGLEALARMAAALPARRRALVIGQAGDRDDDSIRAFARSAWAMRPDRVFIKEMEIYLRGRERGVIPAMIEAELLRLGMPAPSLERTDSELEAVRAALNWAGPGDLLLLTTHAQREEVIALVERLAASAWSPGTALESAAGDPTP